MHYMELRCAYTGRMLHSLYFATHGRILLGCYPYCITLVVIYGLNENMINT